MIGRTVAQYEILAEIGRGGMGVVYKARDTRLRCFRALKFISSVPAPSAQELARLVNEARSLAALEHPNICPVHEIGEFEGRPFIVMSYLEGRTLKTAIGEGPLPADQVLDIADQLAAGLGAAHLKGFVHRDLKPENVMLVQPQDLSSCGPRAVLMDFGIARAPETTQLTLTGQMVGTIAYMAPEQVRGDTVDARTDIWALGVVLYQMVGGRLPFAASHPAAILTRILNDEPDALEGVPAGLDGVIRKALAKDPRDRYQSIPDLAADLALVREGSRVQARRWTRRRRRLPGAIGLAALVLLAGFLGWRFLPAPRDAVTALAVMPLEDRSGNEDQLHFSDGVTDELVRSLSKIGALTVVSARSAAQARQMYPSNRDVSDHLGVDALLEGSVQRVDNRARVSLQLVDGRTDRLIWSESFIREIQDIFSLENEIALAVAAAVEARLTNREKALLETGPTVVPAAYEAYLLGRHAMGRTTAAGLIEAMAEFERAISLDAGFAEPHAEIAAAMMLLRQMKSLPPDSVSALVKGHLQRALEIDPDLAEGYLGLADAAVLLDLDLGTAGTLFAKARSLDPNLGMMGYAQYLNDMGRPQEALAEAKHAVARDPLDPFLRANLAARYFYAGRGDEAAAILDELTASRPELWLPHWIRSFLDFDRGDPAAAAASLERAAALDSSLVVLPDLAYAYLQCGREEDARAIDERFARMATEGYVPPIYLAVLDAAFGRIDRAFAALDAAYEERDMYLPWIRLGFPALRNLRGDPRWDELTARIGLPPET